MKLSEKDTMAHITWEPDTEPGAKGTERRYFQ